jgi:branched-chain amino acid transport system permease protein
VSELQLWVSVVEMGCFFGLLALSYLLILEGAGFFNFALGPYAMVAGLGASWLVIEQELGLWTAVVLAVALVVALAVVTELAVVRPITIRAGGGELPALVAVAAVLFAVEQGAGFAFGRRQLPGQLLVEFDPWEIGDAFVQSSTVVLVGVTLAVFLLVAAWLQLGGSGRLLRAVGDNAEAASTLGLPVSRVRLTAFVAGGLLAAIAGILFAPKAGVSFESGLSWTLSGFLALVVGGTGRVWAPLVGGLVLGGVEVFVPYYFGSSAQNYAILGVGLAFFALRPQGMFTRAVRA